MDRSEQPTREFSFLEQIGLSVPESLHEAAEEIYSNPKGFSEKVFVAPELQPNSVDYRLQYISRNIFTVVILENGVAQGTFDLIKNAGQCLLLKDGILYNLGQESNKLGRRISRVVRSEEPVEECFVCKISGA